MGSAGRPGSSSAPRTARATAGIVSLVQVSKYGSGGGGSRRPGIGRYGRRRAGPGVVRAPGDVGRPGRRRTAQLDRPGARGARRVPTESVSHIEVGATVAAVVGGEVADSLPAGTHLEPAREVLATDVIAGAPADPPLGHALSGANHQITVVMALPAGAVRDGRTPADVAGAIDGPVAAFWAEQTDGAVRLGVTASFDWFQAAADCSDPYALWDQAEPMRAGPGPGGTSSLRAVERHGCASGRAEVGSFLASGGRLYVRDTATSVLAHELGHNFGWATPRSCSATARWRVAPAGWPATATGMTSWASPGTSWGLSTPRTRRNWASARRLDHHGESGAAPSQITLIPAGARAGIRALRTWTPPGGRTGSNTGRRSVGSWLAGPGNWPGLQAGVLLRLAATGDNTSLLLDPTPSRAAQWSSDWATALPVGAPVPVGAGAFTVTVREATAGGARVDVTSGPPCSVPAVAAPPVVASGVTQGTGEIGGAIQLLPQRLLQRRREPGLPDGGPRQCARR